MLELQLQVLNTPFIGIEKHFRFCVMITTQRWDIVITHGNRLSFISFSWGLLES